MTYNSSNNFSSKETEQVKNTNSNQDITQKQDNSQNCPKKKNNPFNKKEAIADGRYFCYTGAFGVNNSQNRK